MVETKTKWSLNIPFGTDGTIAVGSSTEDSIDLATGGLDAVVVYVEVLMGGADQILIEFFGENGTRKSTRAQPSLAVTENGVYDFLIERTPGVAVKVSNPTGVGPSGIITRHYDGLIWETA